MECGACKLICRVGAIYYADDLPEDERQHLAHNTAFFRETLLGRDGQFTGVAPPELGGLGVDMPLVTAMPSRGA